jgi:hypothetical protein
MLPIVYCFFLPGQRSWTKIFYQSGEALKVVIRLPNDLYVNDKKLVASWGRRYANVGPDGAVVDIGLTTIWLGGACTEETRLLHFWPSGPDYDPPKLHLEKALNQTKISDRAESS